MVGFGCGIRCHCIFFALDSRHSPEKTRVSREKAGTLRSLLFILART